jgi:hypothetical protein
MQRSNLSPMRGTAERGNDQSALRPANLTTLPPLRSHHLPGPCATSVGVWRSMFRRSRTNSVVRVERTMRPAPAAPAAAAVARNLRRFPASGPLLSRPPVRPFIVAPKSMTSPLQPLRPRLGDRHDVRRPILRFEGGARRVEPRPIVVDCIRADLGAVGGKCFVRFTAIPWRAKPHPRQLSYQGWSENG